MSEPEIPERPNFRTCKHGNAACLCAECDPVIPERWQGPLDRLQRNGPYDDRFERQILEELGAAEAKVAELEKKLAAMTEDRNLWASDHEEDCPNVALLEVCNEENAEQAVTIERLTRTLHSIARTLSPGNRTMDELMRDMGYACDSARAALNNQE
jgi:hypothetical protein